MLATKISRGISTTQGDRSRTESFDPGWYEAAKCFYPEVQVSSWAPLSLSSKVRGSLTDRRRFR